MKKLVAAIFIGTLLAAISEAAETNDKSLSDEVDVYRALVDAKQVSSSQKILTSEEQGIGALDDSNKNSTRKTLSEAFGDSASEALENWFAMQGKEHALVTELSKMQGWSLVDASVIQGLQTTNSASTFWKRFYEKFPGSGGIVTVTRVGFDHRVNRAVVYVVQVYGDIGAEGSWYYLEKRNNKWSFVKKSVFMMS